MIPAANPQAQYLSHQAEIDVAIAAEGGGNRCIDFGLVTQVLSMRIGGRNRLRHLRQISDGDVVRKELKRAIVAIAAAHVN